MDHIEARAECGKRHAVVVRVLVTTAEVFEWVAKPLIEPLLKGEIRGIRTRGDSKQRATPFRQLAVYSDENHSCRNEKMTAMKVFTRLCAALPGVNGSVLTYGQTGSGKTHSVFGTDKDAGLIEMAARGMVVEASKLADSAGTTKDAMTVASS